MPSGVYERTEFHRNISREIASRSEVLEKNRRWHLGKKHTAEHNKKIGRSGLLNSNFKGNDINYWRNQALIRDNYTCKFCKFREPEIMEVDHAFPVCLFPEVKFEMENLMTLCPNCHRRKTIQERKNKYY